jgi:hypothetical protein
LEPARPFVPRVLVGLERQVQDSLLLLRSAPLAVDEEFRRKLLDELDELCRLLGRNPGSGVAGTGEEPDSSPVPS